MRMKMKRLLAVALVFAAMGSAAPAHAAGRDLAVLVIGNNADKDLSARERAVIDQLTKLRVQRGWTHKLLPIYSYHFDKPAERSYCEDRLKVHSADLLTVGLVELESGVPVQFVYRENSVTAAEPVADHVMDRARAELAARGRLASTVTPEPAPPHPAPVATRPTPSHATPPAVTRAVSPSKPPASSTPRSTPSSSKPRAVAVTTAPSTPSVHPVGSSASRVSVKPVEVKRAAKPSPHPVVVKPAAPAPPHAVAVHPATPHPSADGSKWCVQVGLFSSLEKARALVEKLKESNVVAEIHKGNKDGAVVYRVVVGTFASQAEAYVQAKSMTEAGTPGFSVRIDSILGPVVK